MLYNDKEYKLFSEELEGCSIGTIWSAMRPDNFNKATMSYECRTKKNASISSKYFIG